MRCEPKQGCDVTPSLHTPRGVMGVTAPIAVTPHRSHVTPAEATTQDHTPAAVSVWIRANLPTVDHDPDGGTCPVCHTACYARTNGELIHVLCWARTRQEAPR